MKPSRIPYVGKEPKRTAFHGKDAAFLRLWRDGLDTTEIAQRVIASQAFVANALARLRDAEAQR